MGLPSHLLPEHLAALIVDELAPGESVTWIGQPDPNRQARKGLPGVWIGMPTVAITLLATSAYLAKTRDFSDLNNWTPFLFTGLGLMFGLLFLFYPYALRRSALKTAYVITNRRVLIFESKVWEGFTIRSFPPSRFNVIHRTQFADGTGDLIFHRELLKDGDGYNHRSDVGFFSIPDVKEVEARVRKLTVKKVGASPYYENEGDGLRETS